MARRVDPAGHEAKRRQILDAARACFLRDGFRGASMSEICAAAGMSPGHLYHYFDSKEAIVRAIVDIGTERAASLFAEIGSKENVVEALVEQVDRRSRPGHEGAALALDILAESTRNPAIAEIVQQRERTRCELLSGLVRNGQRRGHVDTSLDPELAAAILSNIFGSISLLSIRNPEIDIKSGLTALKLLVARFLAPPMVDSCGEAND